MEPKETFEQTAETVENQEQNVENTAEDIKQDEVKLDYTGMTEVELINKMREVIGAGQVDDIRNEVDNIKNAFYKIHNAQKEQERDAFVEGGGDVADFEPSNMVYAKDMKELLNSFRKMRAELNKKQELEREDNLKKKYEIIDSIKGLIDKEESLNNTFNEFNALQQQWREVGQVPQTAVRGVWESYHHSVECFYDYIKINKELRDLDFKKNLEYKTTLCEKAEALEQEPSVVKASGLLQRYHEQWRETGPVPRENREPLWERFKEATSKINKKHQDFFLKRKEEEVQNLEKKEGLCEKVEALLVEDITTHKAWTTFVDKIKEIQAEWKKVGYAPKKDNNKIYERFCAACDRFFDKRREFYSKQKDVQKANLKLKEELCEKVEALKDSKEWKATTDALISIQKKWKEIGATPKAQSDVVWKRFRAACDTFFENKSKHFAESEVEFEENLAKKEALIEEVKSFEFPEDSAKAVEQLKEFQKRWSDIGHVPFKKKDDVIKSFRDAINACFDKLKIDAKERNLMMFKSKVKDFTEGKSFNKVRQERDKIQSKIRQMEKELATYERNISFFGASISKNAEALLNDVKRKIKKTQEHLEEEKEKLKLIDKM